MKMSLFCETVSGGCALFRKCVQVKCVCVFGVVGVVGLCDELDIWMLELRGT